LNSAVVSGVLGVGSHGRFAVLGHNHLPCHLDQVCVEEQSSGVSQLGAREAPQVLSGELITMMSSYFHPYPSLAAYGGAAGNNNTEKACASMVPELTRAFVL
jgi:hypothetical protein